MREAVAGYASVTLHYDPARTTFARLEAAARKSVLAKPQPDAAGRLHRIPVVYDGPDLMEIATTLRVTPAEVIRLHSAATYRCFMIGFVPGFAYLGPLPEALRTPRRAVPRTRIPPGSVAIAGAQTGIYPLETPGGWHLIGSTPVRTFLPDSEPPCLFRAGDRVRFFPAQAR